VLSSLQVPLSNIDWQQTYNFHIQAHLTPQVMFLLLFTDSVNSFLHNASSLSFIPYDKKFPADTTTYKPSFYEFLQNEWCSLCPLHILYYHMCIPSFFRNHTKSTWTQNAQKNYLVILLDMFTIAKLVLPPAGALQR